MHALARDLRYAVRSLRSSPALTIVAALALTLGIGLTTTVFSIAYAALMRGLPYPGGDRVAFVQEANPGRGIRNLSLSIHDFAEIRGAQRSFSTLAAASILSAS